jgi:hypothetical protein
MEDSAEGTVRAGSTIMAGWRRRYLRLPLVRPPVPQHFLLAHPRIFVYVDHIWSTTVSVLLAAFCNQGADRGESEAQCMANTKSLAEN